MGAKRVVLLPVSAPFHCSLMHPAAEALRERLADVAFAAPRIPVVNNIDVAVQTDADAIRDALYRQAFGPVRWVEVVQALRARGLSHVVECGPGKVLAGMVKRIDAELQVLTLSRPGQRWPSARSCWHERVAWRARWRWSPAPRAASAAPSRRTLASAGLQGGRHRHHRCRRRRPSARRWPALPAAAASCLDVNDGAGARRR